MTWPATVYALCLVASCICAALLFRSWRHNRTRLLLWTAVSFSFLALNNLGLFLDMVLFPATDLWFLRLTPSLIAVAVLLYGFIWESDH
jgi:lipopolysaccharide export LptBFGC system permease protein LptF